MGPGLEVGEIENTLLQLREDPQVQRMVLFGTRVRGDASPGFDRVELLRDAARWRLRRTAAAPS
jgi:hypothetical protein